MLEQSYLPSYPTYNDHHYVLGMTAFTDHAKWPSHRFYLCFHCQCLICLFSTVWQQATHPSHTELSTLCWNSPWTDFAMEINSRTHHNFPDFKHLRNIYMPSFVRKQLTQLIWTRTVGGPDQVTQLVRVSSQNTKVVVGSIPCIYETRLVLIQLILLRCNEMHMRFCIFELKQYYNEDKKIWCFFNVYVTKCIFTQSINLLHSKGKTKYRREGEKKRQMID